VYGLLCAYGNRISPLETIANAEYSSAGAIVAPPTFIAGDWGTSHLRMALCDVQGQVYQRTEGLGAAHATGRFAEILEDSCAPWREQWGELNVVLAGMVGSRLGWVETPYLKCPLAPAQIATRCTAPPGTRGIRIVPGICCRNRYGVNDLMRGEETQILGALQMYGYLGCGRQLLGLPGTHSKWVVLQDGVIIDFLTAPSGEVFTALRDHTVLVEDGKRAHSDVRGPAFTQGLQAFNRLPEAQLLHRLFECRSRTLSGEVTADGAAGFLSGLIIASDVFGALRLFTTGHGNEAIHLIGTESLTGLYAEALGLRGSRALQIDGGAASIAGLAQVHAQLIAKGVLSAAG
jgi:2-dehydro-3-deoxygalactonokinase